MPDQVELITYCDRLGGSLPGLKQVLDGPLAGLFGGVHILPFYRPHDGADAGFDPADHTEVDPRLGSWADIREIAADYPVTADLIVNHVSSASPQFQDWLRHGPDSPYDGMFLTFGSAFPKGATESELMMLTRPRPGLPFTVYEQADGTKHLVWTTFTEEQIDIDVRAPLTLQYLQRVLDLLAGSSVKRVRLDAVGYAVKSPGLTSFMTEETFAFIHQVSDWCAARGLDVIVEVHSYFQRQVEIAAQVDKVYDFALPPLVLHALTAGDVAPLLHWFTVRPTNAVTVLDTHDGIGVIDVAEDGHDPGNPGLLSNAQITTLIEAIHRNSGETSLFASGGAASNVDIYQVNSTFYDALGADDGKYLLARAIQFFTPGTPQVYYVGLLAGHNDVALLTRTNIGRDVNRHSYTRHEIAAALNAPVVRALCSLIRIRNSHPAFDGDFTADGSGSSITMSWSAGEDRVDLVGDTATGAATIAWTSPDGEHTSPLLALADSRPLLPVV